LISFSVIILTCDKSTDPKGNSIFGKWMLHKTVIIETHNGIRTLRETDPYDPEIDQYYHAQIIEITKNQIIGYENGTGSSYFSYPTPITVIDSMIIITDQYFDYEEEVTVTVQDTGIYSFEGSLLVFKQTYEQEEYMTTLKLYLKKYKGGFPPKSWTTPLGSDPFEPDNIVQNAKSIPVGGSGQTHTLTKNDWDWIKFTAEAGKTYLITLSGYMDNVLTLFEPDGKTIIAEDDDNDWNIPVSGNVESVLVWDCPASGVYFFSVTAYFSEDEGYYTAAVQLTDMESPLSKLKKPVTDKKMKKTYRGFRKLLLKQ
jgi:hypothetical protein